ncbi:PQQ-binding-like beta-propeller repeat protein [Gordonia shandongensis]|uniref:outer membrane protein assembly factor BamB family protein n=1 Tax=Gordonia shandongensis TaxID=376351 RepID=UPI00040789B4|nr:PQQ-binding-like beta-propeller repeat protein [Gordonia shandongensis]
MIQAARRRTRTLTRAAVLAAATVLVVTSCSDGHTDVRSVPAPGWSTFGGDAGNTDYSHANVPDDLAPAWERPTEGAVRAPLSLTGSGDVMVTAQTRAGCNLFALDHRAGRKNFCKRMADGFWTNTALVDQYNQPYIGEPGRFLAFTGGGAIRWRQDVNGVPTSAKFAAPERVLVTTSRGEISIVNSQTGDAEYPAVQLWRGPAAADPAEGIDDCRTGGPACAVAAPPAVDGPRSRFFLNFHPQGGDAAQVKAMSYADGEITDLWTAELPGGMVGPPTATADGRTVYAFSRENRLYAFDAETGRVRWSTDVGDSGFATLTVSPDGLIIPAGTVGAPLTILRDTGDGVEVVARNEGVRTAGLSTLTAGDRAWTVGRTDPRGRLALLQIDATDGSVVRSLPLGDEKGPQPEGFATGVAVGASGQIAVATTGGTVYYFAAPGE